LSLSYNIREATLADSDALVHHRIAMFTDMGMPLDAVALDSAFRAWLAETMTTGTYRAWVVEEDRGAIVGGGGMTILPWPPGPRDMATRLGFVYNVYVEEGHRRRGVARRIMEAIHAFCRDHHITSVALNASRGGLPLYKEMGYVEAPAPMMFFAVAFDQQV
jgi:GNAT superfamily N-acetyltransferase